MRKNNINSGLDKIKIIESGKLSSEFYFQSLLEEAYNKELLNDNDIERLQYECLNLIAYKTERYNSGDSSSIRVEKAQSIMTSNLFTIGLWLKSFPNPDDAVIALQNESIKDLYQKGRNHIDVLISDTKTVHAKLLHQLIDTKNVFYRSTLEGGISGFFKLYYPDYTAHEIHITADYQLFNHAPKLAGIEFIKAYVEAAYWENLFCSYFTSDDIHHLLCGYMEDYEELLINIYELVLTAALGCIIAGADAHRLDVSEVETKFFYSIFSKKTKTEILSIITNALVELNCIFQFSHELMLYIKNSLPIIAGMIEIAVRKKALDHIFFSPAFPENNPKFTFDFGDKMEDGQYRKLVEKIKQCHFSTDKVAIIKKHIHSLADLEDVLLDAYLTFEETQTILHELSLSEIAALSKKYMPTYDIDTYSFRENEQLFRKYLHDFITGLSQTQQEMIKKASEVIKVE